MSNWIYWLGGILIGGLILFLSKRSSPVDNLFGSSWEFLSIFNKGFCPAGGLRAFTLEQSYRNLLVSASTGAGKTSASLVSSLFTLSRSKTSVIVLDVAGEIFDLTSGFLSRRRKIYCFDPLRPYDGFNPLAWCKTTTDIDKVAGILIRNAGVESKSDQFWTSSAEFILSFCMQYLYYYGETNQRNMAQVVVLLDMLMTEPEKMDQKIIRTNDERLIRMYKTIIATPDRTRQSVMSTAVTATKLFRSPDITRCTSVNTFSFEDFRKEPSILYLRIPLNMLEFMAPLNAILFELLFQEALSKIPKKNELPVFMIIDEMLSMRLNLGLVFSQCRKYKIGCLGVLQSERMLQMRYSTAEAFAIKSNATRVFLPGQNLETCLELQETIGKCLVRDENGKERYSYGMEASQIRTSIQAIALINSAKPIKLNVIPYFNHFINNSRTKIKPFVPEEKLNIP